MSTSVYESANLAIDATLGNLGLGASQPLDPDTNPLSIPVTLPDGTERTVQPLVWGGQVFYSQESFDQWAKVRGIALKDYFTRYVEAGKIYDQLAPPGSKIELTAGEHFGNLQIVAVLPTQADGPDGTLVDTMSVTWEIVGAPGQFTSEVPFTASWPSDTVAAMLAKARQVAAIYGTGYGG